MVAHAVVIERHLRDTARTLRRLGNASAPGPAPSWGRQKTDGWLHRLSRYHGPRTVMSDGVDLYWIPLGAGAGGAIVRWNGRLYEALAAALARRPRCALYHSALEVHLGGVTAAVEMAPVWTKHGERGVVSEGPVGARFLGRSRLFRYEVRCWRGGSIPDLAAAVGGPIRVSSDPDTARTIVDLVPEFPAHTWGRDELGTGEMWNSNSLASWLLARAGLETNDIGPPPGGRAPGWHAGLVVASRAD